MEDKKRKSVETEFFDNDEDFESMLQDIDFDQEIGQSLKPCFHWQSLAR